MTQNSGVRLRKLPENVSLQQPQISPSDMLKVPVYILGEIPPLTELNEFLFRFGCQTDLSLQRPIKVWVNLEEDIVNEADKVLAQFVPEDLNYPFIAVILPPLVSLATAIVVRIKERCPTMKVLIIHYRKAHEPHFIGFELFCG